MVLYYENILSQEDIIYLSSVPEVLNAKKALETRNTVYFSLKLPETIIQKINKAFGLTLANEASIPMRWIKGDTRPHVDTGASAFDNTYLMYLTDSEGSLKINDEIYPIVSGRGYSFSEGLQHETVGTGIEPRLLLGPMSEAGIVVGSVIKRFQGETIYFKQEAGVIQYSIDDQATWINVGNNYPLNIQNETLVPTEAVKVEFLTDITFDDNNPINSGQFKYFICGSSYIQFGSKSLKNDGTRPIIIIDGIPNYPGLIGNGTDSFNGLNNIYIYNLEVRAINTSGLISDGGWIGQAYFGKGATDNYIVNCSSSGPIIDAGGGIVGGYAGSESNATLYIIGCSSDGNTGVYSGGIIGFYAGRNNGTVICECCWSTGSIGNNGGGIFGYSASDNSGLVTADKCYSTGAIVGDNAGGIYGQLAGNASTAEAINCYSRGSISGTNAGGIYGGGAASDGGFTSATNCYSSGPLISGISNGIYSGGVIGGRNITNCYIANDSWNKTNADNELQGIPLGSNKVGNVWVETIDNYPYELNGMGYTPYSLDIIDSSSELVQIFSQTISAGQGTSAAIRSGYSYDTLQISGGDPSSYGTISDADDTTGIITTTNSTASGTYSLVIRNTGSYNITVFELTISGGGGGGSGGDVNAEEATEIACCEKPMHIAQTNDYTGDFDYTTRNKFISGNTMIGCTTPRRTPIDYTAMYYKKMAYAAKR